ncbi:MAG: sigma-70 family RNA polymerase sigma factor [Deltaproteobacteria bacterium]
MDSASGRPDPDLSGNSDASSTHGDPSQPADTRRFADLVQTEVAFVWRLLRRVGLSRWDADDAAQQVFLVAARRLSELVPGKERSFLYGTAVRIASNLRRGARRRREESEEQPSLVAAGEEQPDELLERRRARAFLDELLERLPDELRRVLVLAEIEQLALARIAELEGIPAGTAASRLRRAREAFRGLLEAERHRNPFQRSEP